MNYIKLKDMKIKLLEIIFFMNQGSRYMILKYLKQQDRLVIVFIIIKSKHTKLIKNKLIYILSFNNKTKPRSDENKNKKMMFLIVQEIFMKVEN